MTDEEKTAYATVRQGRHDVSKRLGRGNHHLSGVEGLTQDEQVEKLQKVLRQLDSGREQLVALIEFAKTRDFDTHQAAKQRNKDAYANTGLSTVDLDDDEEDESAF